MSHYLLEADKSAITEIMALVKELPTSDDLSSLTPEQAICIGFIKGVSTKVGEMRETE